MQSFFLFVVRAARQLGGVTFRHSIMKRIFLIFMMMIPLSQATVWENEATVTALCDNTTMHLNVNFTALFEGTIYQSRGYFTPQCSYTVPFGKNVTEVELSMPFRFCEVDIEEVNNKTIASTEIVIQMHSLLDSIYDKSVHVSCEISNFAAVNETDSEESTGFEPQSVHHSWIELKNGLVLLGEVGEPVESSLFLVVYIRDDDSSEDMVVQNCMAHTDRNVTNTTNLVRLSDFYGCNDPSAVLPNFTVVRSGNYRASMFAYAPIANFSLLASRGRMSISCGITVCENSCPAHCNGTRPLVRLPLSDYVTKDLVRRQDGAVMPESLRELNRHNDRTGRMLNRPKRSLSSFFTGIFRWESRIVNGSVSERNVTSIGMAKVVKHGLFAKDVLVPAHKPVDLENKDSDLVKDEFIMDGQTFRFIALITICMFISIVACYCCYTDESKKTKGQSRFIF